MNRTITVDCDVMDRIEDELARVWAHAHLLARALDVEANTFEPAHLAACYAQAAHVTASLDSLAEVLSRIQTGAPWRPAEDQPSAAAAH